MKKFLAWMGIIGIAMFLVIYHLFPESCVLVNPGQRGILKVWGRIVPRSYEPGLVWKIPYSKEWGNDVMLLDIKPQRFEYNFNLNTKDLQRISFKCAIVCEFEADSVHRLIDKYPGGLPVYEHTVINDLVSSTLRALMGQTDIWMFVAEGQDALITEATRYIVNDNLLSHGLVKVSSLRNLGYQASDAFERYVEETVNTKQKVKLEEQKAEMARLATLRVKEEALQTYERLAAVAKAAGLDIQIKAEALKGNPFVAQYEMAKALQNWKGELTLPQVFTLMQDASGKNGSDVFKFFPIPTQPVK